MPSMASIFSFLFVYLKMSLVESKMPKKGRKIFAHIDCGVIDGKYTSVLCKCLHSFQISCMLREANICFHFSSGILFDVPL